jgi:septal ring factor EnvC (AmiA/AmiB activator)
VARGDLLRRSKKQEARSKKQEARSKKQEARSKKQEARSKKQEEEPPVQLVYFLLLTSVSGPYWLLDSCF